MTARTFQITLGSGATPLATTPTPFNQLIIGNPNASDTFYIGASNVTTSNGIPVLASGTFNSGPCTTGQGDASQIYAIGTAADKVNVFLL